ncbi:TrbC/VirB2 family protein [Azospirillum picis]|nr:TrbC/VirB2 family protein [Azospirillum picis]
MPIPLPPSAPAPVPALRPRLRSAAAARHKAARCCPDKDRSTGRPLASATVATAFLLLSAAPALAQATGGGGDITTFLQNLVNIITGATGRLLAVLAICVVGVGALLGALSMRTVGGVLLGVLLIFSSAWLVDQIIGA